jgi:single-strand DNA-binding protein
MASLNQCNFIGNLGADPEVKSFQNGGKVANLRLAVSESWKDKTTGERKEKTEWITVAIFSDGLVGVAERFLRKGSKIFVSGKMATRKWQDQSGADRYSTEIVLQGPGAVLTMLDSAPAGGGQQRTPDGSQGAPGGGFVDDLDDLDDDIPFISNLPRWRQP